MQFPGLIPLTVGTLLALGFLAGAFVNYRKKRLIDDLPTSKALGVFIGVTELKGTAESEEPLTSYLAEKKCVYYRWQVEEHWSRTVTETHRDSRGRTHIRTRTESGWKNVAGGEKARPFYLKDDTGIIRIVPEKAKIHGERVFAETVGRENPLYFGKGPAHEVANSDHRRRFLETIIPLHASIYVVGQARERQDSVAAEIAYDQSCPLFLISTRTEKQISTGYGRWFWFFLVAGLALLLGGIAVYHLIGAIRGEWLHYIIGASGYLLFSGLIWFWLAYNNLINLHHRVEQGWSQVEIQLKRRRDLIPNLVSVVEGYRAHEREVQAAMAEMRTQMLATPPGKAGPDYKGLAKVIQVTLEKYPELKASEIFLKLQENLVNTEERIALARDYYNQIATFYNTRLEQVPDRYVAAIARLHPAVLMQAGDFERAPIKVQLVT